MPYDSFLAKCTLHLFDEEDEYLNRLVVLDIPDTEAMVMIQEHNRNLNTYNARFLQARLEGKSFGSYREPDFLRDKILGLGHSIDPSQITPNRKNHTTVAKRQLNKLLQQKQLDMFDVVNKFRNPTTGQTPISWTKFRQDMQKHLRDMYKQSFTMGAKSTGAHDLMAANNMALMSDQDAKWLDSSVRQEMMYFNRFLDDVRKGKLTPKQAIARMDHYFGSSRSMYLAGRALFTPNIFAVYWVINHRAEHCEGCLYLRDHSPYHKYNLPTTPGAGSTPCLGNCRCRLLMAKMRPDLLTKFLSQSRSRDYHVRNLARIKNKLARYEPQKPV